MTDQPKWVHLTDHEREMREEVERRCHAADPEMFKRDEWWKNPIYRGIVDQVAMDRVAEMQRRSREHALVRGCKVELVNVSPEPSANTDMKW